MARALFNILGTEYLYKFILFLIEAPSPISGKTEKSHLTVRSVMDRNWISPTGVLVVLSGFSFEIYLDEIVLPSP